MPTVDTYGDLPTWIRPGAKLAALSGSATLVTVQRFTRTQIVCASDGGAEYRFYRTPVMRGSWKTPDTEKEPEWRLVGDIFVTLVKRDHPHVVRSLAHAALTTAARRMERSIRERTSSWASQEERKRPIEERAFDFFDEVENIVRAARRNIEQLIDPGGFIAAEHAQNLTTTTTEETS